MRPVNLIPPEDRRGERAPLRTGPVAYLLVAVLLLAFGGVYAVVSTGNTISEREAQVTALERELESSTARAEALRSFSDFAALEQTRTETVSQLAASRFDWERVLRELTLVVPEGITLTSLAGAVACGVYESSNIEAPNLTVEGCTTDQEIVATLRNWIAGHGTVAASMTNPSLRACQSRSARSDIRIPLRRAETSRA